MPRLRDRPQDVSSSYLLQHVDNPVEWYSWSSDALERARELDRPIFLSIGYAACHWCHVMAHESFENPDLAAILNESFVPIKVDREERPDLDALYMAATQLISGHGGWPMSVFLTPDGRPFMAGTYYPPVDRGGHVGFDRLLAAMRDAWVNQRDEVERQADQLAQSASREIRFLDHLAPSNDLLDLAATRTFLRDELVERLDSRGGFSAAPKFPRPTFVEALLEFDDAPARAAVDVTLGSMSRLGLFDHLRGGFARYSVDDEWHVPHFEKMLSDQALLARSYFRAAKILENPEWHDVALATLDFVESSLRLATGYASSLDADAGGVEGSHVTWTPEEVRATLTSAGLDASIEATMRRWRLTETTFEGRSIPQLAADEPFNCPASLLDAREVLRAQLATRVSPGRDEKVILEWNAMYASALFQSDDVARHEIAFRLLSSLGTTHYDGERYWRTEARNAAATAGDLAWYVDAFVDAFEVSGDVAWLDHGLDVATYLLAYYWEGERPSVARPDVGGGFALVDQRVHDLAQRPQEIFDGATPSAHAVATRALARLALCRDDQELLVVAQRLVELARPLLVKHPVAVADLVAAASYAMEGVEIVVPGDANVFTQHVRSRAMFRAVLISGPGPLALFEERRAGFAYVCRGGVCDVPTESLEEFKRQLHHARA